MCRIETRRRILLEVLEIRLPTCKLFALLVRCLAFLLLDFPFAVFDLLLQIANGFIVFVSPFHNIVFRQRHLMDGRVIEDSGERIVVELRNRIELVVVTSGTRSGDSQ